MEELDNNLSGYIDEGGAGLESVVSQRRKSGRQPSYGQSYRDRSSAFSQQIPYTQKLSDVIGQSDYGDSTYDEDIDRLEQLYDLEGTRANIQPFIDKLGAGIGTFAGKTLTATAGGIGTLFNLGNAIFRTDGTFNERLRMVYDNDFNKALESINNGIDEEMKVYMSDEERNGSFFDQTIGSSHFWTKSLLGDGMSFTAGAILSAYAMGGVGSLISKVANSMKLTSAAFTGAETLGALRTAVKIDQAIGKVANTTGLTSRMVVGAGYEGGVEANDFIKQSTQRFQQDYYAQHGEMPDADEMKDFNNDILPTANALFLGNVALVGASNLATLPGIFGKGVNETIKEARKGIGSRVVDGVTELFSKSDELTKLGKVGRFAKNVAKPLASEGLMEEGGQNFGKNLALDYIDKHYNPDSAKNVYDIANSMGNAFNNAYMTKDGWKEILSGMIIGGMGGANLKNMGAFEEKEDGTKVWNKFGNIKNRKLFNSDAQNSWWTGGIAGEFQKDHENELRAKDIITEFDKYKDINIAMQHVDRTMREKQGIASQIGDINHQNSTGVEFDNATLNGDYFTAHNMQHDSYHMHTKSRLDAGIPIDMIIKETIEPTEKMSASEFAEQYGYDTTKVTETQIKERQQKVVQQAKDSLMDTAKAIEFADNYRTFNLGTEEGRLNRNMLIYAIATNKSVGDRIDKLNDKVIDNIDGRLDPTIIDIELDKEISKAKYNIELGRKAVKDANSSMDESQMELIPTYERNIKEAEDELLRLNKIDSKRIEQQEAREKIYNGEEKFSTVQDVKDLLKQVKSNYKKIEKSADEDARYNETVQSLEDLIKLYRRKEEALELYAITKDPENWKNFINTERVFSKRIPQKINQAGENIAQSQNEEHEAAVEEVKNGASPEKAAAKTGSALNRVLKFVAKQAKTNALRLINSEEAFLKSINAGQTQYKFKSIDEFEEYLIDMLSDPDISDKYKTRVKQLLVHIDELQEKAETPPVVVEQVDTEELLSDNKQLESADENEITKEINTKTTEALTAQERKQKRIEEGDKIVYAHDKIAWESELKGNKELNKKASIITQDFESLNVGDKLVLEPVEDDNFEVYDKKDDITTWGELKKTLTEDEIIWFIPITIKKDGVIVGMVHTTQFIKNGKTSGDPIEDTEKLIELRTHVLDNKIFNSEVEYRGNGKLIGKKTKEGKINTEQRPTTEAFPDNSLVITIFDDGKIDKSKLKAGTYEIINEDSIAKSKNSIQNAPYALLPVNKNSEGKTQYIAVPLSPRKLSDSNPEVVKTLSTLIRMYAQQKVNGSNEDLDRISSRISDMVMFKNKTSDVSSINGLKNIISMFTYNHTSFNDNLNLIPGKTKNSVIGVNEMKNGEFVVTFGVEGHLNIFKFKDGQALKWIGAAFTNVEIETVFDDLENELNSHFQSQIFYHNRSLMDTTVNIPILHEVNGMIDVKFESKPYEQLIKENTQTNLGSYNIGTQENQKYIYTVQGNIAFKQPKVEEKKVEVLNVVNVNVKPEINNVFSEKIVEDALNLIIDEKNATVSFIQRKLGLGYNKASKIMNELESLGFVSEFNEKTGRKILKTKSESQQKPEVQTEESKPQSKFKKKGGAKIDGLNDSLEGVIFSPSLIDESITTQSEPIENKDNLGKSFIEFANEQPKEIRQDLKRMLRDKKIQTKCN